MSRPLRRASAYLTAAFLVLLTTLALLPWWLAPVLRGVGRFWGAEFATYERIGYKHFVVRDLRLRLPGVHVSVSEIHAPTPVLWLWLRWTANPEEIVAGNWSVMVLQQNDAVPSLAHSKQGWLPLRSILQRVASGLDTWLQRASVGPGEVSWPGGKLQLSGATWSERNLSVPVLNFGLYQGSASLNFPAGTDRLRLSLLTTDKAGRAQIDSTSQGLTGKLFWWDQPLHLRAEYAASGWLPNLGTLEAKSWQLPGSVLKLGEHYTTINGQGLLTWREASYSAQIDIQSVAKKDKNTPPFELQLKGYGDLGAFTLQAAHATMPGISMDLSAPVTIDRLGKLSLGEASFTLLADLAKQPWFDAQGTAKGLATLASNAKGDPVLDYSLTLHDLSIEALAIRNLDLTGRLQWPRLILSRAALQLTDSEAIEATGSYDFSSREFLHARLRGDVSGNTLAPWLPKSISFATVKFSAHGSGPLANLAHSGSAEIVALRLHNTKPLAAHVHWNGRAARIEKFTTEFSSAATKLSATGTLQSSELGLTSLSLLIDGKQCLGLSAPATLNWKEGFSCSALLLEGQADASLAVNWSEEGSLKASLHKIPSRWFRDLLPLQGPSWQLESLVFEGTWNKGPMTFSLNAAAALDLGAGQNASLELLAQGDKDGLHVTSFTVNEGTLLVLKADLQIPLCFFPGPDPSYTLLSEGPLKAELSTGPASLFWRKFSELSGLEIKDPQAKIHVEGTWAQPLGKLHLQAARLSLNKDRFDAKYPALENLELILQGDTHLLTLEKLSVTVEGQSVQAHAKIPFVAGDWRELWADPLGFARRGAEWSLAVPDADLSAFVHFLPQFMAPKGRVKVDLRSQKDGLITGSLLLHDAASRPLGSLGVLQEINADLSLTGRSLDLRAVTAKLGGQLLTLSGAVQYPTDGLPRYALLLKGENLPFVRQTGLLVRGDLNLRLESSSPRTTLLAGNITMRDSLLFSDLKSLLPRGTKGPSLQAPFFALTEHPFAAWQLDVTLLGKGFLRVRTPVFKALASARFHLRGTLADPLLIGEASIDEGQVLLPFASLKIMEGYARITEGKPHELDLYLRGSGHRYNYELGMELRGSMADPRLTFTSSPPLDSEQLMLMVMTGAAPANEIVFSSSQRFARIGTYLGQTLLGSLSGDTGGSDRISVSSGEKVSRQGRETYEVEYKLDERWKWIGEYDEFDDFNFGIKWRLYPGKAKETHTN